MHSIVVVESDGLQPRYILCDIGLAEEGDGLTALISLHVGDGRLPIGSGDLRAADVVATIAVNVGLVDPEL